MEFPHHLVISQFTPNIISLLNGVHLKLSPATPKTARFI